MNNIIPIIICGGNGTRMWPVSRSHFPKQFIKLADPDMSMLQQSIQRVQQFCEPATLVCNEKHRFLVAEQVNKIDYKPRTTLLEPCSRNTAPAIALAAIEATQNGDDPVLLVVAADHVIEDPSAFESTVINGMSAVQENMLLTFGIVPTRAETGYGYIEQGASFDEYSCSVKSFTEKPDETKAQYYLSEGGYLWNSGMFLFKASAYLSELEKFNPEMLSACRETFATKKHERGAISFAQAEFEKCPNDSIDYAVMEQSEKVAVIPLNCGWNDIGSWRTVWELDDKDEANNSLSGDVICHDSKGCLLRSEHRLVSVVGVEDLVVIETSDAVMVAHKDKVEDIKQLVGNLKQNNRNEHELHRQVYRPWGHFDSIDQGDRFQVKHITVKPGEKLSLQMHHHRAEHWIIVSGTANVTKGNVTSLLVENQSIYIPIGENHSLENPGKVPLELIEVQSGTYLGEDDIVRFSDQYGRH